MRWFLALGAAVAAERVSRARLVPHARAPHGATWRSRRPRAGLCGHGRRARRHARRSADRGLAARRADRAARCARSRTPASAASPRRRRCASGRCARSATAGRPASPASPAAGGASSPRGPYRFIRHPNYLAVILELASPFRWPAAPWWTALAASRAQRARPVAPHPARGARAGAPIRPGARSCCRARASFRAFTSVGAAARTRMTTSALVDVVIAGAGPAGCATALACARRGLEVLLVDRARFPRDKPCGEGLLPSGVGALAELGLFGVVRRTALRLDGVGFASTKMTHRPPSPPFPTASAHRPTASACAASTSTRSSSTPSARSRPPPCCRRRRRRRAAAPRRRRRRRPRHRRRAHRRARRRRRRRPALAPARRARPRGRRRALRRSARRPARPPARGLAAVRPARARHRRARARVLRHAAGPDEVQLAILGTHAAFARAGLSATTFAAHLAAHPRLGPLFFQGGRARPSAATTRRSPGARSAPVPSASPWPASSPTARSSSATPPATSTPSPAKASAPPCARGSPPATRSPPRSPPPGAAARCR